MTDIVITNQNIEAGLATAVSDYKQSYTTEQGAINSILAQNYIGLNIDADVKTLIDNAAQQGALTQSLYNNVGAESEAAAKGYVLELGELALQSQKDLGLVITREVKALTAQGFTIQQAYSQLSETGAVKTYMDRATGVLVRSETILSETTHIPVGKVLSASGKALGAYGMYEMLKNPVADAYNATTGAGDTIEPLKSYTALGTGAIVGGAIGGVAVGILGAPVWLSLGAAGVASALVAGATKTVLDSLPSLIDNAKAAGKSLAEVYDEVNDLISDKINEAYNATGAAATALLDDAEDIINGLGDGIKELADDLDWALDNPEAIVGELPDWLQGALGDLLGTIGVNFGGGTALGGYDPLTLDLNGDGQINLTSVANGVHFDFWNDGFAERTGWVAAGDGMLVWDKDADGNIEGFGEMIASASPLSFILESGGGWPAFRDELNGFAQLALLDDNGDGLIDNQDTIYTTLQVWQDLNQNGISEAGELFSLAGLNIASIDAGGAELDGFVGMSAGGFTRLIEGNTITHKSSFTLNDGTEREIVDVWFDHDLQNSRYTQDYTLDIRTLFLPTLRGYGNLPDLHVAMSQNETLLTQVESFATGHTNLDEIFSDFSATKNDIKSILLNWAGVDDSAIPALSDVGDNGVYAYMSEYNFLAQFTGIQSQYLGTWFDERPFLPFLEEGIPAVQEGFNSLLDGLGARLMLQAGAGELFETVPAYNPVADVFEGTLELSQTAITNLGIDLFSASDVMASWQGVANFIDDMKGFENLTANEITWLNDAVLASSVNALNWTNIVESFDVSYIEGATDTQSLILGTEYDDVINEQGVPGQVLNLELYGYEGDDIIYGREGDDILVGGLGNDYLVGGRGNDTFIYDYGHDILDNDGWNSNQDFDVIEFGVGINVEDVKLVLSKADQYDPSYVLQVDGRGTLSIKKDTISSTSLADQLDELQFADGTIIQFSEMDVTLLGSNDDDNALQSGYGFTGTSTVYGFDGDDSINLLEYGAISQTVYAGAGNDIIIGDDGDNSYYLSEGNDAVQDDFGGVDKIIIPDGYGLEDLEFYRTNTPYFSNEVYAHATILIDGYGSITIDNQFYHSDQDNSSVEYLELNDGTLVSLSSQVFETIGTDGNDVIIDGSSWENKDSIYHFSAGQDEIHDNSGVDRIIFSANYSPSDISFVREKYEGGHFGNGQFIGLSINDNLGNKTYIYDLYSNSYYEGNPSPNIIEYAEFSDGTVIDILSLEIETHGTDQNDQISGLDFGDASPDDIIFGYAGDDSIFGGAGNDIINPGAGDDYITGDAGDDKAIYEGVYADYTIVDNGGTDITVTDNVGAEGIDALYTIEELIFSDGVFDVLNANFIANINIIDGDENDNTLNGTNSIDIMNGLGGNDTFVSSRGDDTINGGSGTDRVDYSAAIAGVTVNLHGKTATDSWGDTDTLNSIEDIMGSEFNDTLVGSNADNVIEGLGGDDLIQGRGGIDTIYGGDGIDDINGHGGDDMIYGGDGSDILQGSAGNDHIFAEGGDDISVQGGDGDDVIDGGAGDDQLRGQNGNDTLIGGLGIDRLDGEDGIDTADFSSATNRVITNLNTTNTGDDGFGNAERILRVENIIGSDYNDTLLGSNDDNTIWGGDGNDTIKTYDGNDVLYGEGGIDYLYGFNGDDVLDGGEGADALYGQAGSDTFKFEATSAYIGRDNIKDFSLAENDKVDISDLLNLYDPLNDLITDFVQITDNGVHSYVAVDADGGADNFQQVAQISFETGLTDVEALVTNGTLIV